MADGRCTGLQLTMNMGLREGENTEGKMAWSYVSYSQKEHRSWNTGAGGIYVVV